MLVVLFLNGKMVTNSLFNLKGAKMQHLIECELWDAIFKLYEENKKYKNPIGFTKMLAREYFIVKRNTIEEVESQEGVKLLLINEEEEEMEENYYDA